MSLIDDFDIMISKLAVLEGRGDKNNAYIYV